MKNKNVSIFSNLCPVCHEGHVFKHFWFIEIKCPSCEISFEKEDGYFFGPMIISYFITLLAVLPVLLMVIFKDGTDQTLGMTIMAVIVCVIGPILYRYSKLVWLHIETGFARKMQAEQDRAQKIADERRQ
jgi:uncharacterized protein (DUF983 family)